MVGPPTFLAAILHKCRHFSLDACCYFLVVSGWSLLFSDGLGMDAVISWWSPDGHCYFLMGPGWMLLFPDGLRMDAVIS